MQPPKPLKKEQLEHKTDCARRSKWNGDKRKNQEEQGFHQRRKSQGLTVTEGTRPPSGVKPAVGRPGQPCRASSVVMQGCQSPDFVGALPACPDTQE